jgi:hypothetical protein
MTKEVLYLYTGTNGSILSPVQLEDTFFVRRLRLTSTEGKSVAKDGINLYTTIVIPEDDLDLWYEV